MLRTILIAVLVAPWALAQPNVLLIVADDMGVDLVNRYYESGSRPCTPNIDRLAREGLTFRNAWANPSCSPTRAQILTGLHARRNGVGGNIRDDATEGGLRLTTDTLPRRLTELGYDTALLGKWHLADRSQGPLHPNEAGYGYYAGSMYNLAADDSDDQAAYGDWEKNTQGVVQRTTRYATRDTARDAVEQLETLQQPFFLQVSFNAPHEPRHWPPLSLCHPAAQCRPQQFCRRTTNTAPGQTRAMVESLDERIGFVLETLYSIDPDAIVIFMGDNGTAENGVLDPFDPNRAKNTMYEGGLNIPLIVNGPGVVQNDETSGLVAAVDVYATILELAGAPSEIQSDSISFAPLLVNPEAHTRAAVFAESFNVNFDPLNGFPDQRIYERAARNDRYKLIRTLDRGDVQLELYDLRVDRFENENLYPPDRLRYQLPFEELTTQLVALDAAPGSDVNGDGVVDLSDLARVLAGVGTPEPGLFDGDTDLNGQVDLIDVQNVVRDFGIRS